MNCLQLCSRVSALPSPQDHRPINEAIKELKANLQVCNTSRYAQDTVPPAPALSARPFKGPPIQPDNDLHNICSQMTLFQL